MVSLRKRAGVAFGVLILAASSGIVSLRAAEDKDLADWPAITEQEKSLQSVPQDPEADAVILRNTRDGRIILDGRYVVNVIDYHWRLKVLTDRGKRLANVHLQSQKAARVSQIEARTLKADGTVVPVPADQIFEKVVEKGHGYKVTEQVFNFPAVEPGVILEYRYRVHSNFLIYMQPWYFTGPEFTLLSRVSQAFPGEASYRVLCHGCPGPAPEPDRWEEGKLRGKRLTVERRDVPGFREEKWMPPDAAVRSRLELVLTKWAQHEWEELGGREGDLFINWDSVARFARYYYAKAYKVDTVAARKAAVGWSQGASDPLQKARAVFRHVQEDFKYVPYSQVLAQTRSIADILKTRSADNEEKAVLLVAALRSLDIPANLALVIGKDKGTLIGEFYSLSQFSHVIVALPQPDNSAIWLDPTVTYAPFGFLPWQDSGAGALYMTDTGSVMINLPQNNEFSATRYQVTVRPRPDGKSDLDVVAEFQGDDAIEMRQELSPASESARTEYLQGWLKDARPGAELKTTQIEDLDAIDKPLRIKMSVEAPDLVTKAEAVLLVRGCVLECEDTNPISRGERSYPFYVDRGWRDEQTVTVVPPAGMKAAAMPKPAMLKSAIGSLAFSCSSQADGSVLCTRRFIGPRGRWPAGDQDGIRKMFDSILEVDRSSVAFQEEAAAAGGR